MNMNKTGRMRGTPKTYKTVKELDKAANTKKITFKFSDPPKITKTTGDKFGYITIGKGQNSARKFFNNEEDYVDFLENFKKRQMQRSRASLGLMGTVI